MTRTTRVIAGFLCAMATSPALGAEEETKSTALVFLLATTNQGGLQKIPMQSMEACQAAANEIHDQDDAYDGPTLYLYCVADDGKVWAFDRWNREE